MPCMVFPFRCILSPVMNLKDNQEMLSSILKTAQMGQVGIRSLLDHSMGPGLRKALESQLLEYDRIESEAHTIASRRGWEVPELDPAVRFLADRMTRARLRRHCSDSRIADMMIQGNTRGMVKGIRNLHQFLQEDAMVSTLSQKLIDCETANIRQLQNFL